MAPSNVSVTLTTRSTVEDLILELLADLLHEDPSTLRAELLAKGGSMPVDSLDLFDIVADFRKRTQLSLPVRKLKRDTLRSVGAFADFVVKEAKL